jgi:hypothetical protein
VSGNVLPQGLPVDEPEIDPMDERQPSHLLHQTPPIDIERLDDGPMPTIDTTAELLGRASHRKPRARALRPAPAPSARKAAAKPAAKKAAAPKRSRKKAAADE